MADLSRPNDARTPVANKRFPAVIWLANQETLWAITPKEVRFADIIFLPGALPS